MLCESVHPVDVGVDVDLESCELSLSGLRCVLV